MSRIYTDTVLPENSGVSENLNLGTTGDSVVVPSGATLRTNKITDAGGNNIVSSDGSGVLTLNSQFSGDIVHLNTTTVTNTSSVTWGPSILSSTYGLYIMKFYNINPATDDNDFKWQVSDNGSDYDKTFVSAAWETVMNTAGNSYGLSYSANATHDNGTSGFQWLGWNIGNAATEALNGELYLYNPSATTYYKKWFARCALLAHDNYAYDAFTAGWIGVSTAITYITFKMSSGNFDGVLKIYGVK